MECSLQFLLQSEVGEQTEEKREKGKKLEDDKCFKLKKNAYNALRNKTDRARLKNDKDTLNRAIQKQNELLDNYPIWKDKLKNNQVSFKEYEDWIKAMMCAETSYFTLIEDGCSPQTARSVLPTCTKTEIMVTMNLREWRHFIKLRSSKAAHPDIRILAIDLLNKFKAEIPVIFDDIETED